MKIKEEAGAVKIKKNGICVVVNFEMFEFPIVVLITQPQYVREFVEKFFSDFVDAGALDEDHDPSITQIAAMTYTCKNCPPVIWLRSIPRTPFEISTLAHEAVHAIGAMTRRVGIQFMEETEEVFAYAQTHIVRYTLTELWKMRKQKRKGKRK